MTSEIEILMRPLEYQQWGLKLLCEKLPSMMTMAEIGSYIGESAKIFLDSGKVITIYCIDPWENGYDPADDASVRCDMKTVESYFDARLSPYAGKFLKMKRKSVDATVEFPDHFFDFVYIDGCHTYDAVKADILAFRPKIKPGGWLGGHDYGQPGLTQAINEEVGNPDFQFCDYSWLKRL